MISNSNLCPGQGFIKFDYDTSVITINVSCFTFTFLKICKTYLIQVNKFGNGNAQFSVGMGVKRMVGLLCCLSYSDFVPNRYTRLENLAWSPSVF